jgi:two-component system cell cycle sensor histidine kinase/response regulator CckA
MFRHRLLLRQIRKYLGDGKQLSAELSQFLGAVDEAYGQFETDRKLVERSMELSSNELLEANSRLRQKFERDEAVLESLRMSVRALRTHDVAPSGDSSTDLLDLSNLVREQVNLRAAAEEKIREQAALLDTANDAIYVCSLDGLIMYWNQGAERLYGWTGAEALGQGIARLFPVDKAARDSTEQALLKDGGWSGERRQNTKEGLCVVVHSRMTLVRDARGQPQSVFVINTDVTEKKELEAQFLRGQRMESLGALASGIAHDLNNVLVPVVLGTQLLQDSVHSEEDMKTLTDMEVSARRGAEIVKQVLMFARGVESERLVIQPRHFIKEMEAIAAKTFPKKIVLRTQVDANLWPILGDSTQLHQALMNLCINARDAMPDGGALELVASNSDGNETTRAPFGRAQIWTAHNSRPGPHVRLSVRDSGTGIPPETLDKIFEPFFTTKAIGKGTGLGLSTVLGIVRSHGGFVRVVSNVGHGSTFELYFPAAPAAKVSSSQEVDVELLRGNGECILVVDDEQAVRDVSVRILGGFGYRAVSVSNAHDALRRYSLERSNINAVITDMAMPGMDGPALVRALRLIEPGIRIMGMSGHGENMGSDSNAPWDLPVFVSKPFTVERLLLAVHELLRSPVPPD